MILMRGDFTGIVNFLFGFIWLLMNAHATISLGMVGLKKPLKGEYQVALFMRALKTITLEDTVISLE